MLEGEKTWVTNGASADLVALFARTDEPGDRRGKDGIGAFVIPTDAPGYRPGKEERKM
ncbi:MAG: acyl-CoA dehydrogenase family protein, partial [Gemmatimonadota bacterium]